ncbi:hypothetical protein PBY51_000918 [Eleginops maclovinus]|uniref:Uncharacterized protein n=1 Tax=Eleginops maclovinus TaxID=56733 RepID=A0AAN7XNG0_ELEMC|nr:hypothetical protein PBY51_000918 [Eleginops maclovinus]
MFSGFTSLLFTLLFPGGLYFTWPTWPQVGMAVLVRAVEYRWKQRETPSSRARQNGAARGDVSLCNKLNFSS